MSYYENNQVWICVIENQMIGRPIWCVIFNKAPQYIFTNPYKELKFPVFPVGDWLPQSHWWPVNSGLSEELFDLVYWIKFVG